MIEITLKLDYKTFADFWKSLNGKKIESVILDYHCISWCGEENVDDE